jgi:serine/threonine protein kinase
MSPEQAQGQAIDHRTDVWALGACLYEMLTGKQAYELLESYEQTIFAIVLKKPPPLEDLAPHVPESIVSLVDKALEKDLDLRIPDCGTFARLLADAMPGTTTDDSVARPRSRLIAPSARVVRPDDPSGKKDAIVIVGGEASQHRAGSNQAQMAATQPLAPALSPHSVQAAVLAAKKRDPAQPRVSKETLRGVADPGSARAQGPSSNRNPAPTVSGVSVQTPIPNDMRLRDLESDIDYDVVPRKRRGGLLFALFVVSLAGIVGALGFIGPKQWPGRWPPWASWSAWGIGGDAPKPPPTPTQTQQPTALAATNTATTITPTASTTAPSITPSTTASASASTKASASASASASTKPSGKFPGGKFPPFPSASVSVQPSATASDQFGGTGVSDQY